MNISIVQNFGQFSIENLLKNDVLLFTAIKAMQHFLSCNADYTFCRVCIAYVDDVWRCHGFVYVVMGLLSLLPEVVHRHTSEVFRIIH